MGNKSCSFEKLGNETKDLLMQRTGLSQCELELWYNKIIDRATNGKLSKEQMISIYKDMSNLDSTRISEIVDSLERVFDEDDSGYVDVNEFMRGFILTTKGDLRSKIDYTFRLYDENNDNQISGQEIQRMANAITRMLGGGETDNDKACTAIIHQFLKRFSVNNNDIIYKHDFVKKVTQNKEFLALISPFYGIE